MLSALMGSTGQPYEEKLAAIMVDLENKIPGLADFGGRADRQMPNARSTTDDALITAIRGGYVASSDFGWFAPQEVRDLLASTEAGERQCPA